MGTPAERARRNILHGRKRGRRLRPGRAALLEEALPRYSLSLPSPPARLDPRALFARGVTEVWLEIGFGAGDHLAAQALAHPDIGFIGCEPYVNGVASLLKVVTEKNIENIRVFADDARLLLEALESASINRVFALFPDPWPKTRHHKRRFISSRNLDSVARVLEDEAEMRFATDDREYLRWTLAHALRHEAFDWPARGPSDWRGRPDDWPATRYERKARAEGRKSTYLRFRRLRREGSPDTSDAAEGPAPRAERA